MNSWRSKSLGDGMWADIPAEEIKKLFARLFESANEPSEMAVFTRREEGRLHCEVIAYFSPAAEAVGQAFDAHPCQKPAHEGLELLVGNENSWTAHFPERET